MHGGRGQRHQGMDRLARRGAKAGTGAARAWQTDDCTPSRIRRRATQPGPQHADVRSTAYTAMTMPESSFAIELSNVRKQYGRHVALRNLSLQVRTGELFAFLGPNGAGKTTTIKLI